MNRWLALIISGAVCWGTATACSGGGGGAPAGGTGTPSGTEISSNDVKLPDGSIKHPDGSITYPDGSIKMSDGTIKKPDGTIVQGPLGGKPPTTVVVDGDTFTLPETKIVEPVAALAADSGVKEGSIFGGGQEVTAKAQAQAGATYQWTVDGAALGGEKPKGNSTEFKFQLPAATNSDAADNYELKLVVTKDGKSSTQTIPFQVVPAALPKIALTNGSLTESNAWPIKAVMKFSAEGSKFATSYTWNIQDFENGVEHTVSCPKVSSDGMTCEFTPTKWLKYAVTLSAKGEGGASVADAFLVFKSEPSIPAASITGVTEGQVTLGPVTLTGNVKLGATQEASDPVVYSWTGSQDGKGGAGDKPILQQTVEFKDPGVYVANLTVTVGGVPSNVATVNFTILAPLTVSIVDVNQNPLPNAIAYGSTVTLQLKDAIAPDYGAVSYAWYIKPVNGLSTKGISSTIDVTFDQEAEYDVILTVKTAIGATAKASTKLKSMMSPYGVISSVSDSLSYLQRPHVVYGSGSKGSPSSYDWKLTYTEVTPNVVESDPAPIDKSTFLFLPADFGSYLLELVVQNDLGLSTPTTAAFNIRASDAQVLLPFDSPVVDSLYAVSANDIYLAASNGLVHLGADGQWVAVMGVEGVVSGIWARSSNEVYVVGTDKNGGPQMMVYTAKDGWKAGANPPNLISLTGNTNFVVGVDNLQSAHMYDIAQKSWGAALGANVSQLALAPDNTLFTIQNDSLIIYDAQNVQQPAIALPPNNTWRSITVVDAGLAYFANAAGEIYKYDGAQVALLATLDVFKPDPNDALKDIQQFAKALWMDNSALRALTQVGGIYRVGTNVTKLVNTEELGKITVKSAAAQAGLVLANNAGVAYQYARAADGSFKWLPLFPDKTDFLMSPVVGDASTTARRSAEKVFILNATTTTDQRSLQEIMSDGNRRSVEVSTAIIDLCGAGGEAYLATSNGLMKYDGMGNVPEAVAAAGLPDAKAVKSLSCPGASTELYVADKAGVYHTTDGGKNFTSSLVLTPAAGKTVEVTAMHVLWSGEIIVGEYEMDPNAADAYNIHVKSKDGAVMAKNVTANGAVLRIAGPDVDHLYAMTKSSILKYNSANQEWEKLVVPNVPADIQFRDIQSTDSDLVIEANKGSVKIALSDGKLALVLGPAFAFHAQGTADFVYSGIILPDAQGNPVATGPMMLFRAGPMQ